MGFFSRLTIRSRLIFLVSFTATMLITIWVVGIFGMRLLNQDFDEVYHHRLIPTKQIGEIISLMRDNRSQIALALQHESSNPFATMHAHPLSQHTDAVTNNISKITEIWSIFTEHKLDGSEQSLADEFARTRKQFVQEGLIPAIDALKNGSYHTANEILLKKINPLFTTASESVEELLAFQISEAKQLEEAADVRNDIFTSIYIGMVILALAIIIYLTRITINSIGTAVSSIQQTTRELTNGNLTARTQYQSNDELGEIATAFNQLGERFQEVIQDLGGATCQLAAAAEETSAITQQTSAGIKQQQKETESVARAMSQMMTAVEEVAKNAGMAASAAQEAYNASHEGRRVMDNTIGSINSLAHEVHTEVEVIHSLEKEIGNIGSVLDVIRSIAVQTNLLSLNAAIEAARAGAHGLGFAVVAEEVRTLANRTQASTQEIQEMITRLQTLVKSAVGAMQAGEKQANTSVSQAASAGEALDSIARAVTAINEMNSQIASAAEEQSVVATDINNNIRTISQVADETADGAVQNASASQELASLSSKLQGLVQQFRI
ncbi:MAG: methyl-accepting chemotaxis protein [Gammaproteobacteria bacterium]|nr:methyl-accepting chemotaxis protein [Gammaproteobacteria bacterium]